MAGAPAAVLALSKAISRLHKQFIGRGPTGIRITLDGDLVVCLLDGGLTTDEHTLSKNGRQDLVAARRMALQDSMRQVLVAAVEEVTGRRVLSFMSATDLDQDLYAHVFLCEPNVSQATRSPPA